ncbi:hypothetical protein ACF0H5_023145 [Mactra antiquata]
MLVNDIVVIVVDDKIMFFCCFLMMMKYVAIITFIFYVSVEDRVNYLIHYVRIIYISLALTRDFILQGFATMYIYVRFHCWAVIMVHSDIEYYRFKLRYSHGFFFQYVLKSRKVSEKMCF